MTRYACALAALIAIACDGGEADKCKPVPADPFAEETVAIDAVSGPQCACSCRVLGETECGESLALACASEARCCRCPDDCKPVCIATDSPNNWCCSIPVE